MEVAALVISILALILSAIVAIVEYIRDYKITKINVEFEFYRDIYKKYLTNTIPNARGLMFVDKNGKLQDAEQLVEALCAMRRDSMYFMYSNKTFYNDIKKKLQKLEDLLVESGDRVFDAQDKVEFELDVQKYLEGIYELISKAYSGRL